MKKEFTVISNSNNGVPVLCISGMFAGMWMWEDSISHINSDFSFIGTKEALCEASGSLNDLVNMHLEILINLKISKVILLGNSLGGVVAIMLAAKTPDLVKALVISGTPHGDIRSDMPVTKTIDESWVRKLESSIFFTKKRAKSQDFMSMLQLFKTRKVLVNIARLSKTTRHVDLKPYLDFLDKEQMPVNAIWGAEDSITPLDRWLELHDQYDNLNLYVIDNCGHSPMYENPREFSEYLIKTIQNLI